MKSSLHSSQSVFKLTGILVGIILISLCLNSVLGVTQLEEEPGSQEVSYSEKNVCNNMYCTI
jgi:hypothetical protein